MDHNVMPLPGYQPPPEPNIDHLVLEDGEPVESIFAEKLYRLLTETLYSSWPGPGGDRPFLVVANVGLFWDLHEPPLVPDVMLSLDVPAERDLSQKKNNSYLLWEMRKPPDVVIEIVSDRRGGEDSHKKHDYARLGIKYYVIFDPKNRLRQGVLRAFSLRGGVYKPLKRFWFKSAGLGVMLWQGTFEKHRARWLRWCDERGNPIPTGRERAENERGRAESEALRAENERERAENECERAESERKRAESERERANAAEERIRQLHEQLRAAGVEPPE
jgi:Uma2 family endonuclease